MKNFEMSESLPVREAGKEMLPAYEPPRVLTCRGQEILEELEPVQACTFNHSVLICP